MAKGAKFVSLLRTEGETPTDGMNMPTTTGNNPLTALPSGSNRLAELEKPVSRAGLHQEIAQILIKALRTEQGLVALTRRLTSIADYAYPYRRYDIVGEVARLLSDLPLPHRFESVIRYYEALHINRGNKGNTVSAGPLFERVADNAPLRYRARALLALGSHSMMTRDIRTAMPLYRDATRMLTHDRGFDPMTLYFASRMTATIKAFDGDHHGAVADLERMFGLVRTASAVQPWAYYDYMNTFAVELSEVGRLEQARRASEMTITSPYACAFPEWRETFDEIATRQTKRQSASRSLIGVPQGFREVDVAQHGPVATRKLVHMPVREPVANTGPQSRRPKRILARILNFPLQKGAAEELTNVSLELSREQRRRMTTAEKLIRLVDLISHDETDDETIDRVLEAVEEIVMSRRRQRLD